MCQINRMSEHNYSNTTDSLCSQCEEKDDDNGACLQCVCEQCESWFCFESNIRINYK